MNFLTRSICVYCFLIVPLNVYANQIIQSYNQSLGVSYNHPEEIIKDAEQGKAIAQSILSDLYYDGYVLPMDKKLSLKWASIASNKNSWFGQFMLVKNLLKEGHEEKNQPLNEALNRFFIKLPQIKNLGEKGNSIAAYILGWTFSNGISNDYSLDQAMVWYQLSAEKGFANSMLALAQMYKNKLYSPENWSNAFKWTQKAALMGNSKAQVQLGQFYEEGVGVEKNISEAIKWLKEAKNWKNFKENKRLLALEKPIEFLEKAVENLLLPLNECPNKIWTEPFTTNVPRYFTSMAAQTIYEWSFDETIKKHHFKRVDYANTDLDIEEILSNTGNNSVNLMFSEFYYDDVESPVKNIIGRLFLIYQIKNFVLPRRHETFRADWKPRYHRKKIIDALIQTMLTDDLSFLRVAAFWHRQWKEKFPKDVVGNKFFDIINGAENYVNKISNLVAKQGCSVKEMDIQNSLNNDAKLLIKGNLSPKVESATIGWLSMSLLRFYSQTDWEKEVKGGMTPLEVLLIPVSPLHQSKNEKEETQYREWFRKHRIECNIPIDKDSKEIEFYENC